MQLQLSEPGTVRFRHTAVSYRARVSDAEVWCAATMPNGGSSSYCRPNDLQDIDALTACYYEDYIKGGVHQSQSKSFLSSCRLQVQRGRARCS